MTKNRFKWSAMTAAFLAASMAGSMALAAQTEVECNNPAVDDVGNLALDSTGKPMPQPLEAESNGVAQLDGAIMSGVTRNPCTSTSSGRDLDFYSFQAKAGDVLDISILNAYEQTKTIIDLAVFGPFAGNPRYLLNQTWYNSGTPTANAGPYDASIVGFRAPEDGTYYVGISTYPTWFTSMGTLWNLTTYYDPNSASFPTIGSYRLRVAGIKPSVLTIGMEIKPGSHDVTVNDASSTKPAGFRGNAKGSIPVALLSAKDFEPQEVDQSSLRFGKTGQEDTLVSCNGGHGTDVNQDGVPDLICHFDLSNAGFDEFDNQAIVTGKTGNGEDFEGRGWMKIMTLGLKPGDNGNGKNK